MTRDEVLALLQAHREELEALGVKSLDLFGSVARNEARPDSDVDFLVEFLEPGGYFQLFEVQHYLEDLLHKDIDLGTCEALKEHLREPVSKDVIRVFQRMAPQSSGCDRHHFGYSTADFGSHPGGV
ncbi:MAG: nucleotidyltransferase family protein [Cyanobacteria bacterium Co-bin8]|nr:nucleotidyltransferase family protein [Cyanobacteria bacterium Co-bin8]